MPWDLVVDDGPTSYTLIAGRHQIGRKNAAVLVVDPSVSRKHAWIKVEGDRWDTASLSSRPRVTIEDCGSKFGTFWRRGGVDGAAAALRLAVGVQRQLEDGDRLLFGAHEGKPGSALTLRWRSIVCSYSRLEKASTARLHEIARQLGAHVSKQWVAECTHLVAGRRVAGTMKLVHALAAVKPIVDIAWLEACLARPSLVAPLPAEAAHPYPTSAGKIRYTLNAERRTLFSGCFFVFVEPHADIETIVAACGGVVVKAWGGAMEEREFRASPLWARGAEKIPHHSCGGALVPVLRVVHPGRATQPRARFEFLAVEKAIHPTLVKLIAQDVYKLTVTCYKPGSKTAQSLETRGTETQPTATQSSPAPAPARSAAVTRRGDAPPPMPPPSSRKSSSPLSSPREAAHGAAAQTRASPLPLPSEAEIASLAASASASALSLASAMQLPSEAASEAASPSPSPSHRVRRSKSTTQGGPAPPASPLPLPSLDAPSARDAPSEADLGASADAAPAPGPSLTTEEIGAMRVVDLKEALEKRALSTKGRKAQLKSRLTEAVEIESEARVEAVAGATAAEVRDAPPLPSSSPPPLPEEAEAAARDVAASAAAPPSEVEAAAAAPVAAPVAAPAPAPEAAPEAAPKDTAAPMEGVDAQAAEAAVAEAEAEAAEEEIGAQVRLFCTVTFRANPSHNLTRSP
jgi:hypothetical protein